MDALTALRRWRTFAATTQFDWNGKATTWYRHAKGPGYTDEETLIQPLVFPRFSEKLLGFTLNQNLAPERQGHEGRPDFTPADSVTHPFVFETKSTKDQISREAFEAQVTRYLHEGRPRIKQVVLTNLLSLCIFELDQSGRLAESLAINLAGLLDGNEHGASHTPDAKRLAHFLDVYRFKALSPSEKLIRIRKAPPWNPVVEVTESEWVSKRLDRTVAILERDVALLIAEGALENDAYVPESDQARILNELRTLQWRLGTSRQEAAQYQLHDFVNADETSIPGKALRQYSAHVAYYTTTRLMLVRTWEDLRLLKPALYDGAFDDWMESFDDVVEEVVQLSFRRARARYRSLFDRTNNYTWYEPSSEAYADALYELANTYLGAVRSDVLGEVYERLLERIDRKLLGQYYTPRDIIRLIWDLVDTNLLIENTEPRGRLPRVLDIATGSAGFLVEMAARLRTRLEGHIEAGATVNRQEWMTSAAEGLNGIEIQRFPAYLAELNLLIQLGQVLAEDPQLKIPPLGVLTTDSLSLHNPVAIIEHEQVSTESDLGIDDDDRLRRAQRVRDPAPSDDWMDVACGNPPYVGEKLGADMMRRTREAYPYWERFVGPHMDYLYWFLILGISKLRNGGRFGFITTEYWLRAAGARPLRQYLAERCEVDRVILFRDFRLFPDAPGQHSMVITGVRRVPPDPIFDRTTQTFRAAYPRVSVYHGANPPREARATITDVLRNGTSGARVNSFRSLRSPNALKGDPWTEVVLAPALVRQREKVTSYPQAGELHVVKGVETTVHGLGKDANEYLPTAILDNVGWPKRRAGIQQLSVDEVAALGKLTDTERRIVRVVINTADVFPFAAVPPANAPRILYLAKPDGIPSQVPDAAVRAMEFPDDLPHLRQHLERFRPLLERKVEERGERRPWWSLHRPRKETIEAQPPTGKWAGYCVTTRWGGGGRLIVGMAPSDAVPASGLHTLSVQGVADSALLVCGLFNSSLFQELARGLQPGQIRKQDLQELGVPKLNDSTDDLVECTDKLARLVDDLVRNHAMRFPKLRDSLRTHSTLEEVPDDAWIAAPEGITGRLDAVKWVKGVETRGSLARRILNVRITDDLFGRVLRIESVGGDTLSIQFHDPPEASLEALQANVRGLASQHRLLSDVLALEVPLAADDLPAMLRKHREALRECANIYRHLRKELDGIVESALASPVR